MGTEDRIERGAVARAVVTGTVSANADHEAAKGGKGPSTSAGQRSGPTPDRMPRSSGRCFRQRSKTAPHSPGSIKANDNVTGTAAVTVGAHDACFKTTERRDRTTSS